MRIDKFINAVNLTKRRAVAQDMIKHDAVKLNGTVAKASKQVKIGDVIVITSYSIHYTKLYDCMPTTTKSILILFSPTVP